jgi:3-dehydroquinate synthase
VPHSTQLALRHPGGVTPILVGPGALADAAGELSTILSGRRLFTVSSERLLDLHGSALGPVEAVAHQAYRLIVPDGEEAKRPEVAARLWSEMARAGAKRDSCLAAFGGGSVGDVSGFVAGAFARGIEWFQLPTTLLAQVDASIGGKTAIDLPEAKNAVGLFHQPALVVCDTALLSTLPARQLRSGLFEVLKVAALFEPELLATVEAKLDRLVGGDAEALSPVVTAAARLKARVVEGDLTDRGERRLLNFGHTLGHALEAALDYRHLTHGEAVGFGMLFALRLAVRRGMDEVEAECVSRLIDRVGLPVLPPLAIETVLSAMARDKKARESGLDWVLPAGLGRGGGATTVPADELAKELEAFLASHCE